MCGESCNHEKTSKQEANNQESVDEKTSDEVKKRKRPDKALAAAIKKTHDYSCVVMKWNNFCKNDLLKTSIEDIILIMNKIALESYHVLNLYYLTCFQRNIEPSNLNLDLIRWICVNVGEKVQGSYSDPNTDDAVLNEVLTGLKDCRPSENYEAPMSKDLSFHLNTLAQQMEISCKNHIVLNFSKRLYLYLKYKEGFSKSESWHFLNKCYDPSFNKTEKHEEIVEWLGYCPTRLNIKANKSHFIKKSYEILQYLENNEARLRSEQTKQGDQSKSKRKLNIKKFTIMPLKSGYTLSHITLSNSTLQQALQWILKRNKGSNINDHHSITKTVFDSKKDEIWRSLFNINAFETRTRRFAYEVSTNGYAVSVKLLKPKPVSQAEDEDEEEEERNISIEEEQVAKLQNVENYTRRLGGDPGCNSLLTLYTNEGEFIRMTTSEYRHISQMDKQRFWNNNTRKRNPEYSKVLKGLQTFKISNINTYKDRVKYVLRHCDMLFRFCAEKSFRKWKFKTYIYSQKALYELCKRVSGGQPEKTLLGLGDWSRTDGVIKGHPPGPVKKMRRFLKRFIKVVDLDEYMSSKGCSECGHDCVNIKSRQWVKEKGKKKFRKSKIHEIVRCSSNECSITWHRDENGSKNLEQLLDSLIAGRGRPLHLRRKTQNPERDPSSG